MRWILRARSVPWAAAAIAATTLAWLVPGAAAAAPPHTRLAAPSPGRAAAPVHHAATSQSPSGTGASDISNLGAGGWTVQSSAKATQTGAPRGQFANTVEILRLNTVGGVAPAGACDPNAQNNASTGGSR